jgi:hypothetical protein
MLNACTHTAAGHASHTHQTPKKKEEQRQHQHQKIAFNMNLTGPHREEGQHDVVRSLCTSPGCFARAAYGIPAKKPTSCRRHKEKGHVDLTNRICQFPEGCTARASCGEPALRSQTRCGAHKLPGHVNVHRRYCLEEGCTRVPSFGNEITPLRCRTHRLPGEVDVRNQRCAQKMCFRRPTHAQRGDGAAESKRAEYCGKHAPAGYAMTGGSCAHSGCESTGRYGEKRDKPMYCAEHRMAHHVDLSHRMCKASNCTVVARYGDAASRERSYCRTHKQAGHVCIDWVCTLCKQQGHWKARCPLLKAHNLIPEGADGL